MMKGKSGDSPSTWRPYLLVSHLTDSVGYLRPPAQPHLCPQPYAVAAGSSEQSPGTHTPGIDTSRISPLSSLWT